MKSITRGGIRTHTGWILSPLPLPLGYAGAIGERSIVARETRGVKFDRGGYRGAGAMCDQAGDGAGLCDPSRCAAGERFAAVRARVQRRTRSSHRESVPKKPGEAKMSS